MMSMLRTSYNHVFDLCFSSNFPDSFAMYLHSISKMGVCYSFNIVSCWLEIVSFRLL